MSIVKNGQLLPKPAAARCLSDNGLLSIVQDLLTDIMEHCYRHIKDTILLLLELNALT